MTADALLDSFLVEIWEDKDGNGAAAAAVLREALAGRGVPVTTRKVSHGKDPAAAGGPFPYVDPALLDVEAARTTAADGLPLAEARRLEAALLMEAAALDSADAGVAA